MSGMTDNKKQHVDHTGWQSSCAGNELAGRHVGWHGMPVNAPLKYEGTFTNNHMQPAFGFRT
jgi:hypothetical protein